MAIINRYTAEQIAENFTHKGWLFMCPVYVSMTPADCPDIQERNWIPEWWADLNSGIFFACVWLMQMATRGEYEPEFPVRITARIKPKEHGSFPKV
ncbi:hypothetical protein [Parendozoicomonas sp. Alg238-R29]|uniref:hypothetical protein n=1 Tax=Parendozoicomonas sp. Alg238-R29 TaxID=2993446 RepID=UPI00248EE0D0|nr:hypothetical protein [Parendozoicomonas sp. Alg238-R29]